MCVYIYVGIFAFKSIISFRRSLNDTAAKFLCLQRVMMGAVCVCVCGVCLCARSAIDFILKKEKTFVNFYM